MLSDLLSNVFLGITQGLTEFIPVSSSGHLIVVRDILSMQFISGLSQDAVLQLATTLAVIVYFRKDLYKIFLSFIKLVQKKEVEKNDKSMVWAIIIGTIPAVFFGILLENPMETIFRHSIFVAGTLIIGSIIMIVAENKYAKLESTKKINKSRGLMIGFFQALALFPGMSRSGMTIAGGLFYKLDRNEATKFSFILAVPILVGSGLKKLFELMSSGLAPEIGLSLFVGSITSFIVGLIAIHFLIKFLKNHTLKVFAYYRILLAIIIITANLVF